MSTQAMYGMAISRRICRWVGRQLFVVWATVKRSCHQAMLWSRVVLQMLLLLLMMKGDVVDPRDKIFLPPSLGPGETLVKPWSILHQPSLNLGPVQPNPNPTWAKLSSRGLPARKHLLHLVKPWSNLGQAHVTPWSNLAQPRVKPRSNLGQTTRRRALLSAPALRPRACCSRP